ncbi:MAG: hypothetical protein A2W91_11935 [Bacteroidetes bacterium GWF2_38_335]|nr:MAG: hypothetical protein A2W91_11935 [Bacteroidetes bacterium GWF2_38_335]OFY76884.1 MAG: hypothetical protein A2281_00050 [Bacteroidetes bacterium RIFOXYA12_FULL_38_20]HBS86731.1 NADH dehydrogenase subunit [Bacteroidales bacterium]
MNESKYISIFNFSKSVKIDEIPVLTYDDFSSQVKELLSDTANHCVNYFAFPFENRMKFICCIARDSQGDITVFSHEQKNAGTALPSLTTSLPQMHIFEQEIYENFGVVFEDHPWMKPVRFPNGKMDDYPFYKIEGDELHEVGVGPVHAGVIEPGHFRFICNGEKVLHLEIHLGYQHRGIEKLYIENRSPVYRMTLSENIAGDTAIGHGWAHAAVIESLSGITVHEKLLLERLISLELERIAIHIGDTSALCTDVAYQFGQVVNEALRTTIINTTQLWCGNRFGKGLIRPGGTHYPMTNNFISAMQETLKDSGNRYTTMADRIFTLPTVLARFDGIGTVTNKQVTDIGAVGMAARMAGLARDIRFSHPATEISSSPFPVIQNTGDVLARGMIRNLEVRESLKMIAEWVEMHQKISGASPKPDFNYKMTPGSFAISLVEGWRGEICHCALTDNDGELMHYKVKDPSLHNWFALALAVRNQEISDFPVCNKSFNLSYCGNDL